MADGRRWPRAAALAGAAVAALVLAPGAMAGSTGGVEVEADLVSPATGARIAAIAGSVDARGRGYASIVPLSGAASVGMARGEAAQMRRLADGSLLVVGGLGTRVRLAADERAAQSAGAGRLSLALRARRTVPVAVRGVAWSKPFTPGRGQQVIVVGTATGAIRTALAGRYRLVRYSPSTHSRAALLANPSLYRRVAGVLVGQNVTTGQMKGLDLPRAFYNSGRWVATSRNPTALDRHMYVVAHAHLGRAGVIMRRATPPLGRTTNQFMQIREPRIAHVRVGASRTQPNAVPARLMRAMTARSRAHLAASLARAEPLATGARAREAGAVRAGAPPFVPNTTGQAVMQVAVDQMINVTVSNPSWLQQLADTLNGGTNSAGSIQCSANPAPGTASFAATLNFVPAQGTSCPSVNQDGVGVSQQVVSLTYNNLYTVSLATGLGSAGAVQLVTETTGLDVSVVADPASTTGMAAGQYQTGTGIVQPATYGAMQWFNDGGAGCVTQPSGNTVCPPDFWQNIYGTPQEAGFTLAQANHMINVACPGCRGTLGKAVTPTYYQSGSSPAAQVQQASGNATSGTDWDQSRTSTRGWSVSGNLGFFGGSPMGGVGGGYNSSTSSSSSTGGQFSTSTGFTYANWVTNPTGNSGWAVYSTNSQNLGSLGIPATSPAYPANFSVPLPGPVVDGGGEAFVPLPTQYGPNNPGPSCPGWWAGSGPALCTWGIQGVFGSQMNASDFQQGSVTSFKLFQGGNNQLAVGTVAPSVADTLYLWDQWVATGYCECWGLGTWNGLGGANSIPSMSGMLVGLQVLDLDTVQAAQQATPPYGNQPPATPQQPGAPINPTAGTTGKGLAGSLTTYYGANGQVLSGVNGKSSQVAYTTLGLDLCAPPVLTSDLWSAGCDKAPGLVGRPATVAGAGPTVTGASGALPVNAKGNPYVAPGTPVTCSPGTWSGSPTFAYQWSQWNATVGAWGAIAGATSNTYTPTTAGSVVLCTVTATNPKGSTQSSPPSVLVS